MKRAWLIVAALAVAQAGEAPTSLIADHERVRLSRPATGGKSPIEGAELHYFYLRGLGEVPRLMLELAEVPYDSVMYFSRETKEYKEYAPFGQMPLYRDKELGGWIAQQGTIVRHIARRTGLAGQTPKDEATIDMLFELSKDIAGKKDLVHEGAASDTADAKKLKMYLSSASKMLGAKPFFVYSTPTYADVAMFHVLNTLEEITAGVSYLTAAGHESLLDFVKRFRELKGIKEYLASERRVPLTEKELGKGSSEYKYVAPLSSAALAKIDTVMTKPEL